MAKANGRERAWAKVYERDGYQCRFCGRRVYSKTPEWGASWKATVDHLVPESQGGSINVDNLVMACRGCNGEKGESPALGRWSPRPCPASPVERVDWPTDIHYRPTYRALSKVLKLDDELCRRRGLAGGRQGGRKILVPVR